MTTVINDYIAAYDTTLLNTLNIDKDPIEFIQDEKGNVTLKQGKIFVKHNRKDPIDLTNLKLDKFDRKYAELQRPFSYQIMKPILDKLKETYKDTKVYCDLKRVYTTKETTIDKVYLSIFHNVKKNTINVMLRAF